MVKKGININIQKKDLWILSAVIVFLIGVGYVVAYGGTQPVVMGHSFGELQLPACNEGQILKLSGGSWSCKNDDVGSVGTLNCAVSTSSSPGDTLSVNCASSRTVTGGGCICNTLAKTSRPSGNGWRCDCVTGGGGVTAYAVCCSIA